MLSSNSMISFSTFSCFTTNSSLSFANVSTCNRKGSILSLISANSMLEAIHLYSGPVHFDAFCTFSKLKFSTSPKYFFLINFLTSDEMESD